MLLPSIALPFALHIPKSRRIMPEPLIFAIPKGRILDEALPLLAAAGIVPAADFFDKASRALVFGTNQPHIRLIRVRSFDVATFVAHGAAHLGIVGSDAIDEFSYSELYAPVDLDIGHCRLSLAAPKGVGVPGQGASHVRVATKYPASTRRWFEARGIQAECIKLNGAMEIAPALGLASHIVDLVSSGATLKENGLEELAVITQVSARLIVNRAAFKLRPDDVPPIVDAFRTAVGQDHARLA
jgi:ATP phosphoribosyltransferase